MTWTREGRKTPTSHASQALAQGMLREQDDTKEIPMGDVDVAGPIDIIDGIFVENDEGSHHILTAHNTLAGVYAAIATGNTDLGEALLCEVLPYGGGDMGVADAILHMVDLSRLDKNSIVALLTHTMHMRGRLRYRDDAVKRAKPYLHQ